MTPKEKRDILAELVAHSEPPHLEPDMITIPMFAAAAGVSTRVAGTRIAWLVEEGKLEPVGKVLDNSHWQQAWRYKANDTAERD